MKFFFLKTDSLYKIFKTLEKIPAQKAVQIFIDPEHPFFWKSMARKADSRADWN